MNTCADDDDIPEHLTSVGLVCAQWAHLEWYFEITFWWLIGLLNRQNEGRAITAGLNLETIAKRTCKLSHLRMKDEQDRKLLERVCVRISNIVEDRNLAVHGVRALMPDGAITASISRGKNKGAPRPLPLTRLRNLNVEIASIIDQLEPLLLRLGIIEGTSKI